MIEKNYIKYLISAKELFARAYAQYIVLRSSDRSLANEFAIVYQYTPAWYPEQWEAADFGPIANEMDKLMEDRQWRVP